LHSLGRLLIGFIDVIGVFVESVRRLLNKLSVITWPCNCIGTDIIVNLGLLIVIGKVVFVRIVLIIICQA
jgi:hypothetical protein